MRWLFLGIACTVALAWCSHDAKEAQAKCEERYSAETCFHILNN